MIAKVEPCFIIGAHPFSFRAGQIAEILGVAMVTPRGSEPRACFHIRFHDGIEDYTPVSDSLHYKLLGEPKEKSSDSH